MNEHGEFTIKLSGNIIHVYPSGGFNEFGVKRLFENISATCKNLEQWVLFEHPDASAGLTPEAVNEMAISYQKHSEHGCQAIALEIGPTWEAIFQSESFKQVTIPIYCGRDSDKLLAQLNSHL